MNALLIAGISPYLVQLNQLEDHSPTENWPFPSDITDTEGPYTDTQNLNFLSLFSLWESIQLSVRSIGLFKSYFKARSICLFKTLLLDPRILVVHTPKHPPIFHVFLWIFL